MKSHGNLQITFFEIWMPHKISAYTKRKTEAKPNQINMQFRALVVSAVITFAAASSSGEGGGNLWTCPCGEGQSLPEPCEGSTEVEFIQGCYKGKFDTCTKFSDKNANPDCSEELFSYFISSMDDNGAIVTDIFADEDCTNIIFSIPARNTCECSNNFGVSCDFFATPGIGSCGGIPDSAVCPAP